MKYLIVAADDFGYSPGVVEGIIKAHTDGIVTSTSVLVDSISVEKAKDLTNYPKLSVGLHVNIWDKDLGGGPDEWEMDEPQKTQTIQQMFDRQLAKFIDITDRDPDHIDGHFHLQNHPLVKLVFEKYSRDNNVPVRGYNSKFIDSFFARDKDDKEDFNLTSVDALIKILSGLENGVNEVMTHPGIADDYLRKTYRYSIGREKELETLTDPRIREFIQVSGIKLISWKEAREL